LPNAKYVWTLENYPYPKRSEAFFTTTQHHTHTEKMKVWTLFMCAHVRACARAHAHTHTHTKLKSNA